MLGIMFLCVIVLNIFAYFSIMHIGEIYASWSNAAVNLKLKVMAADITLRALVTGSTVKDMNGVWDPLDQAESIAKSSLKLADDSPLLSSMKDYRQFLVDIFVVPEGQEPKPIPQDFFTTYTGKFDALIGNIETFKSLMDKSISGRLRIFKVIYVFIMVNILLLFVIVVFSVGKHTRMCEIVQNELADTKNNLDIILNSTDSLLVTVDKEMTITHLNNAASRYLGADPAQSVGRKLAQTAPMLEGYLPEISKVFYSGKPAEFYREKILFCDGTERFYNITANQLLHGAGGVVIRIEDITAPEVREEQIRQSQKMEVVENIIESLTNDFNNVLGAINASVSMLKFTSEKGPVQPSDLKNSIEIIENSIERAVVMVRQLTSISKRQELTLSPVDLNISVSHVIKICEKSFDKRISLKTAFAALRAMVKGDPALIETVILNLCENAAHAMTIMKGASQQWGGELRISVTYVLPDSNFRAMHPNATKKSYWAISVSDTGVGIDREVMPHIFDPFYSTKGKNRGMGLGLSTIREIVGQHSGFIDIASVPGEGTTATVYIPEIEEQISKVLKFQVEAEVPIPTGAGLILVVDDEGIMRKTAHSILTKLGYEVIFAENGIQAIDTYSRRGKDISMVMLDLSMPKMDGKETFVELKKINPLIKAIIVSGMETDKRINEMIAMGAKSYVPKPYSMISLAQAVKKVIG